MRTTHMIALVAALLTAACSHAQPVRSDAPPAGTLIVHPADGALMAWVPAGEFVMGMDADEATKMAAALGYDHYHKFAAEEWFPRRRVWLPGFFMDVHEVTVHRWKNFVIASEHKSEWKASKFPESPADDPDAFDLYPVVRVLWAEAQKYANYYGKALPRETQWEKAARGTDGRWYPWGNEIPRPGLGAFSRDIMDKKVTHTYPVGSFPKGVSPYGLHDMSGNVYEWTSDWFEPYPNNPEYQRLLSYTGHTNGVLRGGSFYHAKHSFSSAKRFGFEPTVTYFHVGFRTVWEPPTDYFTSDAYKAAREGVAAKQKALEAQRKTAGEPALRF